MSWNIAKPGDQINGPVAVTGNLNVDSNTLFVDSANNRVGVLTASPTVPLDVVGDASVSGALTVSTGTAAAPAITPTSDSNTGVYFPAADTVALVTNGAEGLRIVSSQRVGLGHSGTAAAPSIARTTDDNSGFYFPANDTLGFATGGVERLRIDSTGQVGIGKTPTLGPLDVNADAYFNTVRVGLGNGDTSTNTAVGAGTIAGASVTGARNTGVGSGSLNALSSGNDNVGVGRSTLSAVASGSNNIAIGSTALAVNTASDNTAVGYLALTANTSGTNNVAVGRSAGAAVTTGSRNTHFGNYAGDAITSSGDNCAFGHSALSAACSNSNTAIGSFSLSVNTASNNTALGYQSLNLNTSATDNTAVGFQAGDVLTTGASNTIIGSGADASAATGTGQIVIGKGVTGTANNRITVGITTNIAELDLDGADTSWAASSDERLKKNVADYAAGLDVITALRPVTYQWRSRKEVPTELTNYYADSDEPVHGDASKTYHGFIAQEVKAVLDANPSVPNGQHLWEQRDDGVQTLAPADLVPILVNAIKQLSSQYQTLHAEVQALKNA